MNNLLVRPWTQLGMSLANTLAGLGASAGAVLSVANSVTAAPSSAVPATCAYSSPMSPVTFLLCRKADFDKLSGFSTESDYGLVDIDLCLRLQRDLGKVSWCLTGLSVQHGHTTTRKRDKQQTNTRIESNHQQFKVIWADRICQLATPDPSMIKVARYSQHNITNVFK